MASPLNRRVGLLLSSPPTTSRSDYLVPPLLVTGPGVSTAAWDGPLRVTAGRLPFAVLLCVALVAARRTVRRTPAGGREA